MYNTGTNNTVDTGKIFAMIKAMKILNSNVLIWMVDLVV
jgi:hypothetical protein